MSRTCSTDACTVELGSRNKSGLCRACLARRTNADPVAIARRAAAIQARFDRPGVREEYAERRRQRNASPSQAERDARSRQGKRMAATLVAASRNMSTETRAANGRKRTETTLPWCPEEWRDTYRSLARRGMKAADAKRVTLDIIAGKPRVLYAQQRAKLAWCPAERRAEYDRLAKAYDAAQAKAMVLADMAAVERRRLAALPPFERQMERIRGGAKLVGTFSPSKADHAFTLGGIASGML